MARPWMNAWLLVGLLLLWPRLAIALSSRPGHGLVTDEWSLAGEVRAMFLQGYENYTQHAYPKVLC